MRFLSSSHDILPARVADVTGGLLHFKLAGDYFERYFTKSRHAARPGEAARAQRIKESLQAEGGLSLPHPHCDTATAHNLLPSASSGRVAGPDDVGAHCAKTCR